MMVRFQGDTMFASSSRIALGLTLTASILLGHNAFLSSQDAKKQEKTNSAPLAGHGEHFTQLYGAKGCMTGCHDKLLNEPDRFYQMVRGVEGTIWSEHDRHKEAFLALSGERAQRMEDILKASGSGWERGVRDDPRCLNCHGVVVAKNVQLNPDMVALKKDGTVDLTKEGVTCMVCHGMDSRWFDPHQSLPNRRKWRSLSGPEKQQQFGMTDLWDPVERAKLCSSCHIGNGRDKMVTHEMYAAGHPPLPGFEVASFSDAMPRHWETIHEKLKRVDTQKNLSKEERDAVLEVLKSKYRNAEKQLDQTEMVVTGGVVALRQSFQMVADQASQTKTWPELAVFDCYACHHELRVPSWRQERGYQGKPGRPSMRPWPTALAQLAVYHITGKEKAMEEKLTRELADRIQSAFRAFDEKPFGQPETVMKAALAVVDWLDNRLAKDLNPENTASFKIYDRDRSRLLLDRLVSFPLEKGKFGMDFDSARQVGWAFKLIQEEAFPDAAKRVSGPLSTLEKALCLNLPKGKPASQKGYKENEFLWQALNQLNNYSPAEFQADLEALRKQWLSKSLP